MKVVLSTIGRFHHFNLAHELEKAGVLEAIFTGYPRFKLRNTRVSPSRIRSFPYLMAPSMALKRVPGFYETRLDAEIDWRTKLAHDAHVARRLPACDAAMALSSQGLWTGRAAKARGARYVCDRGSSHIRFQDRILREEHERLGLSFRGVDPRIVEREEAEYAEADAITLPSTFTYNSFRAMGVDEKKLRLLPYGVDLRDFRTLAPREEDEFRVLFVGGLSVRKGLHYLLQAFGKAALPKSRLVLVGGGGPHTETLLRRYPVANVERTGVLDRQGVAREMSRASVFVLASVEEGLAMVIGQALACRCPVVATENTGAADLMRDGCEGFIVPIRDPEAIAERLVRLYRDPALLAAMSESARGRVESIGGWGEYGARAVSILAALR